MNKMKLRRDRKRKKPTFHRQEYTRRAGLSKGWRAPKGKDSKMRKGRKSRARVPSVGYGSPREVKGFHPSGKREVLITNMKDLEGLENVVLRLSRRLGKKKKLEIMGKTKLKIVNPVKKTKEVSVTKEKTKKIGVTSKEKSVPKLASSDINASEASKK